MNLHKLFTLQTIRQLTLACIFSLAISSCSGSSDSGSSEIATADQSVEGTLDGDSGTPTEGAGVTDTESGVDLPVNDTNSGSNPSTIVDSQPSTPVASEPSSAATTRVDFDINVPAFMSDELQVRLSWGDIDTTAAWVQDENWAISINIPANTENRLTVTFNDGNGAITLGSFETTFRTGTSASEPFQITADQFNTSSWDNDNDGVSNLDELIAGADPEQADTSPAPSGTLLPVSASVELRADKTFRIRWERSSAADYYRVLENPDGVSGFTAVTDELDASTDYFDHRVSLHKRVNARYMVEACNASGCTQSVQLLIEGSLVEAIGYFKASNTGPHHEFGSAVSVSADGTTMVVGAPEEGTVGSEDRCNQTDNPAAFSGAVYVFAYGNGRWQQQAYLKASNSDAGDNFGSTVSLSADGNTLSVTALGEDSAASGVNGDQDDNSVVTSIRPYVCDWRGPSAGAVYVFSRSGENWQQQAYLKASNTRAEGIGFDPSFGRNLALSGDGNTLAVGATGEDSNATGINGNQNDVSAIDSGAVYLFERSNGIWQQQAYVKAGTHRSRFFGQSVGLSEDGSTLAVGVDDYVTSDTSGVTTRGPDVRDFYGAVYIFVRTDGIWQTQAFLRPEDASWIDFGNTLSLAADGNTLAISGGTVVYLFERIAGLWQQQTFVEPSNGTGNFVSSIWGAFVSSMSLSADGNTLAVGSSAEPGASSGLQGYQGFEVQVFRSGAVYVYTRGDGSWQQSAYVKASNSRESIQFGTAVSLSANGDTLAVGANQEGSTTTGINGNQDYEEFSRSGAVYLY